MKSPIRISFTGHRKFTDAQSKKLDPFEQFNENLKAKLRGEYPERRDLTFVTGAALGVDTWAAEFAMKYKLGLHLYLPFPAEVQMLAAKMNSVQKATLRKHIDYASKVVVVNESFSLKGYGKRNRALVDNSDILYSFYTRSRSGTGHCIHYYVKKYGRPVFNLKTQTYDSAPISWR